jgi:hypothetical protein
MAARWRGHTIRPRGDITREGRAIRWHRAETVVRRAATRKAALALLALVASACVLAYEIGGHHFALVSIYLERVNPPPTRNHASYLELFCAELPDLAMELDAVTQRQHVAASNEWQWGLFGRCTGPATRHMFAAQYYLHGLTGDMKTPKGVNTSQRLRDAVKVMIDQIDAEVATVQPADRLVRVCARGFAAHLLGDSFAHAQLYDPGRRYPPGTGHWKDNHDPDYLLSREILATEIGYSEVWFNEASAVLMKREAPAVLAAQAKSVLQAWRADPDHDYGESKLTAALIQHAPTGWQAFEPPLQQWRPSGWDGIFLKTRCDDQMRKAFPQESDRPSCAAVWRYYLGIAIPAFRASGIDPQSNAGYGSCSANGDELKNGEK